MKQIYTSQYCPNCLNGRNSVDVDFESEHVGILKKSPDGYFCSRQDCYFLEVDMGELSLDDFKIGSLKDGVAE